MQYTKYTIQASGTFGATLEDIFDYLAAELADIGFDSFEQEGEQLLAYIPAEFVRDDMLSKLQESLPFEGLILSYRSEAMPDVNWNEEWEKHYFEPIIIGDNLCLIRAPFHKPQPEIPTEVVISPKMAFGTGNHETTALMMDYILGHNMADKRILDMGCGTGILGILALKQGAKALVAIDIDEWAYQNVLENATLNAVGIDTAMQGDASSLEGMQPFDLILANITRNILLEDMPTYVAVLNAEGRLILSGFYEADIAVLTERAVSLGLSVGSIAVRNQWARIELIKN